jgi:four helix bundle protein
MAMGKIVRHNDLEVYRRAVEAAMRIFQASKSFPKEETYSPTDQVRRSSRSVCANLAEAWRKRRYKAAFISKLSDAEGEAAGTEVRIEPAKRCTYLTRDEADSLYTAHEAIIRTIVGMINHPETWIICDSS